MDCHVIPDLVSYCDDANPVEVYELIVPIIPFLERLAELKQASQYMEPDRYTLKEFCTIIRILEARLYYMETGEVLNYEEMVKLYEKLFPERFLLLNLQNYDKNLDQKIELLNALFLTCQRMKDKIVSNTVTKECKQCPHLKTTLPLETKIRKIALWLSTIFTVTMIAGLTGDLALQILRSKPELFLHPSLSLTTSRNEQC